MELKRRNILTLAGSVILSNFTIPLDLNAGTKNYSAIYFSSGADKLGNYFLSGLTNSGKEQFRLSLPSRGHGAAYQPNSNEIAVFARRPGKYIIVVNVLSGEKLAQVTCKEDRHFYGHGVYSPDGKWLYTTENEYDSGRGVIGVYDVKNRYRLVETLPAYGIGPHEIGLLADGKTMVVANGGIMTHPETGREKLNLAEMDSSLTYIEINSGKLLSAQRLLPKLRLMSIRHLDVGPDDNVAVVMQYQGPRRHLHPLVGFQKGSAAIELLSAPETVGYHMKNYCGSVAFDSSGKIIAVSSPQGGIISFWSVQEKRFLSYVEVKDGCGIAAENTPECFRITNGLGQIIRHSPLNKKTKILISATNTRWDNHLLLAGKFALT
jgi:hypothetical protein